MPIEPHVLIDVGDGTYITPPPAVKTGTVTTVSVATPAPPPIGGGGSVGIAASVTSPNSGLGTSTIARTVYGGEAKPYVWKGQAKPNANTPKAKQQPSPKMWETGTPAVQLGKNNVNEDVTNRKPNNQGRKTQTQIRQASAQKPDEPKLLRSVRSGPDHPATRKLATSTEKGSAEDVADRFHHRDRSSAPARWDDAADEFHHRDQRVATRPDPGQAPISKPLTREEIYARAEAEERTLTKKLIAQMEAGKITAKAANKRFSKALEQIRKTEIVELQPKAAPQGAEFQGRSAWQRVPYYPGQTPTRWAPRGGAMYKNPAWSPSLNELALAALTPSQLAYMRSEYKRNAERFGADAIWLAHHPAVVAAALTTFTLGPEADPFIVDLADAFSAIAAGKALKGRHYLEAGLDAASFGFSKFAANAARAARNEQSAAVEARATAQAAEHAIEMHPRIPQTPSFLVQEFKSAQKALRKAELGATRLRKLAAYERRVAGAFAYAAAEADVAR